VLRRLIIVVLAAAVAGGGAAARASERVDINGTGVKLAVNSNHTALVTYRVRGRTVHVLVWGAINALPPSQTVPQVHFRFDWSGGWKSRHRLVWKTFKNRCAKYAACTSTRSTPRTARGGNGRPRSPSAEAAAPSVTASGRRTTRRCPAIRTIRARPETASATGSRSRDPAWHRTCNGRRPGCTTSTRTAAPTATTRRGWTRCSCSSSGM